MKMIKERTKTVLLQLIISIVLGILLGIIGMWIFSNLGSESSTFAGSTGKEAFGIIGFVVGLSLASILGVYAGTKIRNKDASIVKISLAGIIGAVISLIL